MKRQQTVILKQQEKERRKQHLMMIRALESQRKAEVCHLTVLIALDLFADFEYKYPYCGIFWNLY